MNKTFILPLCGALVLGAGSAALAQGTITEGNANFVRGATGFDTSPDASFNGVSATLGQDHLFEAGWWFRLSGGIQETVFPVPGTQSYVGDMSTLGWSGLGAGAFDASEVSIVKDADGLGGPSPSGFVTMKMTITNLSAVNPLTIDLFHMVDFDVQPTAGNDSATLLLRQNHMRITDPGGNVAEYRGVGARAFLVRPFGATDVATELSNASVTNFGNTGLPFGPGDYTAGTQWTATIAPSGSRSFTVVLAVNVSLVKGDFNDDAKVDVLFRNNLFTQHTVWQMDGMTRTAELAVTPDVVDTNDRVVCAGDDFNKDSRADVVFLHETTRQVSFWLMGGTGGVVQQSTANLTGGGPLAFNWVVAACGDLDKDGKPDILWRNITSQKLVGWLLDGTNKVGNLIPTPDQAVDFNWRIVALQDFDADGHTDFLWYNDTSGKIVQWFMDDTFVRIFGQFTTPNAAGVSNWKVAASGDYGRGGRDLTPASPTVGAMDVMWRNDTSARLVGWMMDGVSVNPSNANTREQGLFTCPHSVGGGCSPGTDPIPPGATDWFVVGPR